MKNRIPIKFSLFLSLLLSLGDLWAQCPQPLNILVNPDFENFANTCTITPPVIDGAFNNGCVQGWQSANQTPSICTENPANGLLYACLGWSSPLNTNYREAIFQNVVVCQGERYQLQFSSRSPANWINSTINIYMASGLVNVPLNDNDAFPINPTWQQLQTVTANGAWTVTTITFTANNLANNQLLFQVVGGGDVFLDNMSLVCISQLTPQVTSTNAGGGLYNYVGTTQAQPPLAVTNWCWDFGDGSPVVSGPNLNSVSHNFTNAGTYTVCLTIQDNCCFCLNTACITIIYDPCACGMTPQVLNTGDVINWTNLNQDINNDVIIAPGTDLNISGSTLRMKLPCKFVVMRGASMTVNSSTLRSACRDQKWGGIVVWGNSAIDHSNPPTGTTFNYFNPVNNSANAPGVLSVQSGSTIRDMSRIGIYAQRQASDPVNAPIFNALTGTTFDPTTQLANFNGGLVRCGNSTFADNDLSADFRDYPFNNFSQFSSCTFTTALIPSPLTNTGPAGVRIWNTDNILFQTCNFDHVGASGVITVNGSITMTRCTLNQNYQGLRATSSAGQTGFIKIGSGSANAQNQFRNNNYGIYSDGIFNLAVQTNTFTNNGQTTGLMTFGGGIFVTGASSFDIVDNDFSGNLSGAELVNTSGLDGSGPNQRLSCNTHVQDRIGMIVRGRCPGMNFRDNSFNNISADLVLRKNSITPAEIHLNQGANGGAIFNFFSENAPDIVSSLIPGNTKQFSYFPPNSEDPDVLQRATPDCDINGFQLPVNGTCGTLNNYINRPRSTGFSAPCLAPLTTRDYIPCTSRPCLDALRNQKTTLENLVNAGQTAYKSDLATVKLHFDTDKRDLAWKWFETGLKDSITQMFTDYGTVEDMQMLFAYHTRARDFTAASSLLESLSPANQEETWYRDVERIYLKYVRSSGMYVATNTEDQLLETVAVNASNAGGYARSTYYLLHDVWLEPSLDQSEGLLDPPADRDQKDIVSTPVFNLAPNPSNELVIVSTANFTTGTIQVMDLQGLVVEQVVLQGNSATVSTRNFPNGMYIVHLVDIDGRTLSSKKLIIQH
jgi:hypothetical protein